MSLMFGPLKRFFFKMFNIKTKQVHVHLILYVTEWLRLEGISGGHLVQPSAQAEPSGAGCSGPYPGSHRLSLRCVS